MHLPRKSAYAFIPSNRFNDASLTRLHVYTRRSRNTYARGNDMYLAKCRRLWKAFRKIRSRGVWGGQALCGPTGESGHRSIYRFGSIEWFRSTFENIKVEDMKTKNSTSRLRIKLATVDVRMWGMLKMLHAHTIRYLQLCMCALLC